MSDHLHTVLHNQPHIAAGWTASEVARRWRLLFPYRRDSRGAAEEPSEEEIDEIVSDQVLVAKYRRRLCDLSWLQRCLNEYIARLANAEDDCTGRFWEGRFKCIRLEGPGAIIACSVYVDLNPIRAGIAKTPETSEFTSIQDRINAIVQSHKARRGPRLALFENLSIHSLSENSYIRLVDETGRALVTGKASLPPDLLPILARLNITQDGWIASAKHHTRLFHRIVGPIATLVELAAQKGKYWFQGHAASRLLFV